VGKGLNHEAYRTCYLRSVPYVQTAQKTLSQLIRQ
jgi:hypothetical protein